MLSNLVEICKLILVLSIYEIFEIQRVYSLVERPAKNLIVQLQFLICVDFLQQIIPLSVLACYRIFYQVQWMHCLGNMVTRKLPLQAWYSVYKTPLLWRYISATLGADNSFFTKHLEKIMLGVWYIVVVAVTAFYDPLSLRGPGPHKTTSSVCSCRCACIYSISMSQVSRHNLLYNRHKLEIDIRSFIYNNLSAT